MSIDELYNEFLSMSEEERIKATCEATTNLFDYFDKGGLNDEEGVQAYIWVVKCLVSADKLTARKEYDLWKKVTCTDLTYEQFFDITNNGSEEKFQNKIVELINNLPHDGKVDACTLALCYLTSDGKLTEEEKDLFIRFIGDED